MNLNLINLLQNSLLCTRLTSESWKSYVPAFKIMFDHADVVGYSWYFASGTNLCFAEHFGKRSVVMFFKLQQDRPLLIFSHGPNDQHQSGWPYSGEDTVHAFCEEWSSFWRSRLDNHRYFDLITRLMNPSGQNGNRKPPRSSEDICSDLMARLMAPDGVCPPPNSIRRINQTNERPGMATPIQSAAEEIYKDEDTSSLPFSEMNSERAIERVEEILSLRRVAGYNIGITKDARRRKAQYAGPRARMPHFEVLVEGLTSEEALKSERVLFRSLTGKRAALTYAKYRENARDRYSPSLGGAECSDKRIYLVYVAWWEVGEPGFPRKPPRTRLLR